MNLLNNLTHLFQPSGAESAGEVPVVIFQQDALIAEWRGQVESIVALTRNPQADSTEITALMFSAYRSGRRIERQLGAFPDALEREKHALTDALAKLWGECKMLMVDLLLMHDHRNAEIMRLRLRTMAKLGEFLDCLDRLHGHQTYTEEAQLSEGEMAAKYAQWRATYGTEAEAA